MTDTAFQRLRPFLTDNSKNTLCFADENLLGELMVLQQHPHLHIISNRWDIAQQAVHAELTCDFSDMDSSSIADESMDQVVYRVSKEKPLVHHIIREAYRVLKQGGELHIAGEKTDGTKTYIDKAGKLFGQKCPALKDGTTYLGHIVKSSATHLSEVDAKVLKGLDDQQYHQVRDFSEINGKPVYTKPGQFGWNKLDRGSALLIEIAAQQLEEQQWKPNSLLDLGCGYGYLTLHSYRWDFIQERCATDNNAAALLSIKESLKQYAQPATVIADDCGKTIKDKFDLVLCNPPFHQGFDVDGDLTTKFLKRISSALDKKGKAFVVVNQFIPIETKAKPLFKKIKTLVNDGSFKVISLSHR